MKAMIPTGRADVPVVLGAADEPVPGADEVLVKVAAYSVNRGETFQLENPSPEPGFVPGKDVAGLVIQAAASGRGPAVGRRVVGHPPRGGWAEYVAVPVGQLAEIPADMCATEAAALPLAGLTALRLLRAVGPLAGRRILLTGASGGVGHYVTELAAAAGAELTAVSATAERGVRLGELGASEVVHEVAAARGTYDVVLESTGGANLPAALAKLSPRGLMLWFGQAARTPVTLDFFDFFAGPVSATIRHFATADHDGPDGPDLATLVRLVAEGRLHPEIGRLADWADTATVLTDLRDRKVRGHAVLTVG
ncbi:MAG: zinc-binding dehydrogenase [Streptomycetaceae bacterium]|nr:zinc-binding dehydrogenase [Streptomycetaceae bacterium]